MAETRPEVTSGNVQGKYHYVGVRCVKFEEQQTDDTAEERLLAAELAVFISTTRFHTRKRLIFIKIFIFCKTNLLLITCT